MDEIATLPVHAQPDQPVITTDGWKDVGHANDGIAMAGGQSKVAGVAYMTRAAIAEARAFASWQDYQEALKRAIAPLTEEHLRRRLLPGLRTPGEIAEHIVFGRALWLHRTLGERAAELTPLLRWEDADNPPHTAA